MSLTYTKIDIKIWISFSIFIKNSSVLPQENQLWLFFLCKAYNFFEQPSYI